MLRAPAQDLGYRYLNLDLTQGPTGEPTLIGDAHRLPFRDDVIDVVVSKETLEHFSEPAVAVAEVFRVLKPGGLLIILVPFMHPFHGNDLYRYSPLGLDHLLRRFEPVSFDSPLWIFTLAGLGILEVLKRIGLGAAAGAMREMCARLDGFIMRRRARPAGFAAAYRVVARKPGGRSDGAVT